MDIKIITKKTYSDTLENIIELIRSRKVDLATRHILFVPDKYTLLCEQKLYAGAKGSFDAEVLTLNRLFFRICDTAQGEYLSKFGAIMLTRKIISDVKDSLKCFKRCADFKGFAQKMYENIAQLSACQISPTQLLGFDGALGLKLGDISIIYKEYLRLTNGFFVDASGRMEMLLRSLYKSDYFLNTVVYFANFDSATQQTKLVIKAICDKSKASYIGETSGGDASCGKVEIYESGNRAQQVKAVAKRIRDNAFNGVSYNQMAVAAPISYGYAKIMRVFSEFDIPYYIDQKCNLGKHKLGLYFKQLFTAINKIGRQEYIALSKNPYMQISSSEQDIFECYTLKYCIDYLALATPFTKGYVENACKQEDIVENQNLIIAEKVRAKIFKICNTAFLKLKEVKNALEFSQVIQFLLPVATSKITKQIAEKSGVDIGEGAEQILNVTAVLLSVFGNSFCSASQMQDAFIEGLDAVEISLIPPTTNCVIISDFTAFRGNKLKALYVLDFNENFPPASLDCGIITDNEIKVLKERNINLEPKIADVNERSFIEAKSLLSASQNLFVSFLASERPGILLNYIYDNAISYVENSPDLEVARMQDAYVQGDNFNLIARHVSCFANAAEMLCLGVCLRLEGENGFGFESELNFLLGDIAKKYLPKQEKNVNFLANASSLFFKKNNATISRIQEYFSCPYKHFLKYGLLLSERDDGVLSPLDVGIFLHKVIEIFVSRGRLDQVSQDVKNIVEQVIKSEPKYCAESFKAVIDSMTSEAIKIASVVSGQIQAGIYKNLGVEMHFGKEEDFLKTLDFKAGERQIYLSGVIDRVDVLNDYARVIDYKTGHAEFSFTDLYYGLKIQLLIYMKILMENGFKPSGMFYFPFSVKWSDNEFSHRLIGLFNNQNYLFEGMDRGLSETGYKSEVINARTKVKLNKDNKTELFANNSSAYDTIDLCDFLQYAYDVLQEGAKEISEGFIAKSPAKKGEKSTCAFCEMRSICEKSNCEKARIIKTIKPKFILQSVNGGAENE